MKQTDILNSIDTWKYCIDNNHRWPSHGPNKVGRSSGYLYYEQCNNCMSMRISYEWDDKDDEGDWIRESHGPLIITDPRLT